MGPEAWVGLGASPASRIDGSTGLLGSDWPLRFEPGDDQGLAARLRRLRAAPDILTALSLRIAALADDVAPGRDRAALQALVTDLLENSR